MFTGEIAVVTGAASNIGKGIATALAGEGAELVLTDVDDAKLGAVADEIANGGGTCRTVIADLASRDDWKLVVD